MHEPTRPSNSNVHKRVESSRDTYIRSTFDFYMHEVKALKLKCADARVLMLCSPGFNTAPIRGGKHINAFNISLFNKLYALRCLL